MRVKNCLVCEALLIPQPPGYWSECTACGFMASTLEPEINARPDAIDESLRQTALQSLRVSNYARIIERLNATLQPSSSRRSLLDVGCAHGWFLRAAQDAGYLGLGIEPDLHIAQQAIDAGLDVRVGSFPDALPEGARFDIITFHDVLEHLANLPAIAAACRAALNRQGLLAVTLPNSRGVFFRVARQLSRLGWRGPLDRLWQQGFPSPHLSYFHPDGLARFLAQHGFREVHRQALPSLIHTGLWQRLRYDRSAGLSVSMLQYAILSCVIPCLRILPSDISFQVFQSID